MLLTVHRGTREIGGNCVELATASTRVILDVGLPLVESDRQPLDARATLKKPQEQLRAEGILPGVAGLFDSGGAAPDAILLSHAHLDHVGLLHLTRAEIPVYASQGTSKMMLAGAVFAGHKELARERYREVVAGQPFGVGDLVITPFAVDHSAFGSLAFLVEGNGKRLLYSGDLRRHGRKPGMARQLLDRLAHRSIDVLLMEGTHCGSEKEREITEHELEEQVVTLTGDAPGLVLAAFSPLDLDRLVTFYRSARRNQRLLVVDAYTAFVLHLASSQARVPSPAREAGIRVYFNRSVEHKAIDNLRQRFDPDRIDLGEVLEDPCRHLMVFRPSMLDLDFQGDLPPGCRCLYSYWKGYSSNPEWLDLQRHLAERQGDFVHTHVSGHIYMAHLVSFVQELKPRMVIPIHTFEPEQFAAYFPQAQVLTDGQPFEIR